MTRDQVVRVVGSEYSQLIGEQLVQVRGRTGGVPGLATPAGKVAADGKGVRVVGTKDPPEVREQLLRCGYGVSSVSGFAAPVVKIAAGVQGVWVVGSEYSLADR